MADVLAVRDEYRAQQWAMVVQECRSSGMTNREYCRQRGISEKSFYYWQRKFRTQIVASAAPQLVQLEAVSVTEEVLQIQYRGAELRLPAGGGYGRSFCIAPLHSVAMIDLSKVRNYYVACGYTDLRRGIDGLAAVVTQQFRNKMDEESLFLFCGRRTDRSRHCTGVVKDISCCTNGCPTGDFNGQGRKQSCGFWGLRASAGLWRG